MQSVRGYLTSDAAGVREVMEASLACDRIPGYLRFDIDRALVRLAGDPGSALVALESDRVVGYCIPRNDDLTIHPAYRRRGLGRRLVAAARRLSAVHEIDHLTLYVPPHLEASVRFAEALGFTYRSSLWRFVLSADAVVPPPRFPADVVDRTYAELAEPDVTAWVAFMHVAFEGHPTRMSWTPELVAHVHASDGFDASGILILAGVDAPDTPVAFARIELIERDAGEIGETAAQMPVTGEVGLIGVAPAWRGRGLGRELLRWSITALRGRGAGPVELNVEAANERATDLYRGHGFTPAIEWPHWVVPS